MQGENTEEDCTNQEGVLMLMSLQRTLRCGWTLNRKAEDGKTFQVREVAGPRRGENDL